MNVTRHLFFGALALVLVAAVGACGDDDGGGGAQAVGTASESSMTVETAVEGSLQPSRAVVLTRDGLGIATFGDDAEESIAAITAVLGEPTADSGWVDPLTISTCAGTQARSVTWGSLSLYFSDESAIATGTQHLIGYSYGSVGDLEAVPAGLSTPEGIGLGTSVDFLRAAYPDVVVDAGEEGVIEPSFVVDERLSGRLTGGQDDDLVTVIIGGDACAASM